MRSKDLFLFAALILSVIIAAGCQKSANSNAGSDRPNNANSANTSTAAPSNANSETLPTVLSQATPTDAYKMAWYVRDKKDVAGMKKVLSKDVINFLTEIGKEDKKSLDDQIKAIFDHPQAKSAESRNEKINGDTATIEYTDEKGEWKTMDFVKEDGVWKMTLGKTDQLEKKIDESKNTPK